MLRRAVLSAIVAAALAGTAGCGSSTDTSATTRTTTPPGKRASRTPKSFADVVAQVRSGVIRIETLACDGQGVGTGILVGPRLVATVEHVIDGASVITLKRAGKLLGQGTVIGLDPARDVALVRSSKPIRGYRFHFAARSPRPGEDVAALGFPVALPLTVTRGSVSGLNRTIPIDGVNRNRLVQTDAAVNPGNSGGPLMTNNGTVVGLVDLGTEQLNGLAFAVSAQVAGPLIESWSAAPQPIPAADCSSSPTTQAAPAPPSTTTSTSPPGSYSGTHFSIDYPAGWTVSAREVNKGSYYDTTITAPGDSSYKIRVDETPNPGTSNLQANAAPVIAALRKDPSYREISISNTTFDGVGALRWEFEDTENGVRVHKVDIFLIDPNGRGWGVLTQAPAATWPQVATALESYQQTFQAQ